MNAVTFGSGGNTVISGGSEDSIIIRDIQSGEEIANFKAEQSGVFSIAYDSGRDLIARIDNNDNLNSYNGLTGDLFKIIKFEHLKGDFSDKPYLTLIPDGKYSAAGYGDCLNTVDMESFGLIGKPYAGSGLKGSFNAANTLMLNKTSEIREIQLNRQIQN